MKIIAWISGSCMYAVPSIRKLTVANVDISFPEKSIKEARIIARKSLIHLVRTLLDFFCISQNSHFLDIRCRYLDEDRKVCETPFNEGNGLIIVCPHLGSWETAGLIMKHNGYPFAVVAKTIRNPYLEKLIKSGRMAEGSHVIPAKGAVRGMVKSLRAGSMVATLIDQNTRVRDGGLFLNFLGLPVPASKAPARLGRKLGAPIVIGGSVYVDGKYQMFMRALPKPVSDYADDVELTQELLAMTEELIREYPEQYLWFYKRFQNIPRDANEETIKKFPYYAQIANERFYDATAKRAKP